VTRLKWHWGWGIAAVYTVFASATLGFAVFAMDQRVELVSGDYYQRALQHDQRMAAEANAAALEDGFRVDVVAAKPTLVLQWLTARPARGGGLLTLYRPSDDSKDRAIAVAPDSSGIQLVPLAGLTPGRWVAQVQWRANGRDYYVERNVIVR
jgi:nitrogen fixation protein FixH